MKVYSSMNKFFKKLSDHFIRFDRENVISLDRIGNIRAYTKTSGKDK
jgi:hypothetical protein